MFEVCAPNYPEELKAARRQLERENLRLTMLENQAANSNPDEFDHWCDLIDATKTEIERRSREVFLADLKWKSNRNQGEV